MGSPEENTNGGVHVAGRGGGSLMRTVQRGFVDTRPLTG